MVSFSTRSSRSVHVDTVALCQYHCGSSFSVMSNIDSVADPNITGYCLWSWSVQSPGLLVVLSKQDSSHNEAKQNNSELGTKKTL
jgi:hypothetical protein